MIEHVSVPISDYKKSKQLYLEALKPLHYVLQSDYPSDAAGFCEGESTRQSATGRRCSNSFRKL
jgi:hypothetical protein